MTECTCHKVVLNTGTREVVGRDWRSDCQLHGINSDWYHEGGKQYFRAQRDYAIELQRLVRLARETGKSQTHLIPDPPRYEDYVA